MMENMMQNLKVAIVGCGKVAEKHIKAINYFNKERKNTQFTLELIALIDPVEAAKEKIANLYKGKNKIAYYVDLNKFFLKENVDILAITTPSGLHYEQAKIALNNHCHILIEKPITLEENQAKELLDLGEKSQLKIAVGHIYRYFPLIKNLYQDLKSGKFGKPLFGNVQVRWGHDQAYYDQAAWRGTRKFDGGAIMNQSIHALDLMHALLGEPYLVSTKGAVTKQIHQMESEDLGYGIFEFENNIWLVLEGTTNTDPKRPEASFFVRYTQGEIRASLLAGKIKFSILNADGQELRNSYLMTEIKNRISDKGFSFLGQIGNPHTGIYLDLANAIVENSPIFADGESGLHALQMVLALYQDAGV